MSDEQPRVIDPQKAVDFLLLTAPEYAKAKAARVYLEQFRKTKKALLMKDAEVRGVKVSATQERDAYADPAYQELLLNLQTAVEAEETARWKMVAAEARVEVWRSQEASNRAQDRTTR